VDVVVGGRVVVRPRLAWPMGGMAKTAKAEAEVDVDVDVESFDGSVKSSGARGGMYAHSTARYGAVQRREVFQGMGCVQLLFPMLLESRARR